MALATEPGVRASHLQEDLQALGALGPEGEAARGRLRPETIRAIEEAPRADFLPVRGAPRELAVRSYLTALCGSLEAVWEVSRYAGQVRLERWSPGGSEAAWLMEWRRR